MSYADHLARKAEAAPDSGFASSNLGRDGVPLFDWQRDCVGWACRKGRAALFADTGLGKSAMQLAWADQVASTTQGRVLILAPLAVGQQTAGEARKFGIPGAAFARAGGEKHRITIANYESLHKFDPAQFAGVVLDESSILKAYSGTRKRQIIEAFSGTPYRLACTATPAPNDHLELGNHAEFLGVLTSHQMISRWFISDQSEMGTYRLKGHAVIPYWDWVCSWARCVGVPSDLGAKYSDDGYVLPSLDVQLHKVGVDVIDGRDEGELFRVVEGSATSIHRERRRTAAARAEKVAELVNAKDGPCVVWVETNYDAEEVLKRIEAVEVKGADPLPKKVDRLQRFAAGDIRVLLTKPKIAGFGLNWQHCARMVFAGPSYSYEALYQAIRRCYRFGQTQPVTAHVVLGTTETRVWGILDRKRNDHEAMKVSMFAASRRAAARSAAVIHYNPTRVANLPTWLTFPGDTNDQCAG